ncbi:radical SAM/SPASM domain-containing protein [Elusimicrobiota bacterium]
MSKQKEYLKTPLRGKRKDVEPKVIYFSWFPTYDCNYRCSYCAVQEVAHTPFTNPPGFKVLPPDEWEVIWKRIYDMYGTCFIHFNGGEPFYYPDFIRIVERIARYHVMEFSTNLSFDVDTFIGCIPPERVYLIGSSFHPEFADFDEYLKKLKKLLEARYEARFNLVAYPPIIDDLEPKLKMMKENGILNTLLIFHGLYNGKSYPDAYTKEDKEKLLKLKKYLGPEYETMINWSLRDKEKIGGDPEADNSPKPPVEDQHETADRKTQEEQPQEVKGEHPGNLEDHDNEKSGDKETEPAYCRMGQMYARIHPDGDVIRCCAKTNVSIGNIFDKDFALNEEAQICEDPDCICWRHMVVGREEEWLQGWPEDISRLCRGRDKD